MPFARPDEMVAIRQRVRQQFPESNIVSSFDSLIRINGQRQSDRRALTQFGNALIRSVEPPPRPEPVEPPRALPQGIGAGVLTPQEFGRRNITPEQRAARFNRERTFQGLDFNAPQPSRPQTSQLENLRTLQQDTPFAQRAPVGQQETVLTTATPEQRTQAAVQRQSAFAENFIDPTTQQQLRGRDPTGRGLLPTAQGQPGAIGRGLQVATGSLVPESVRNALGSVPVIGGGLEAVAESINPLTVATAGFAGPTIGLSRAVVSELAAETVGREVAEAVPGAPGIALGVGAGVLAGGGGLLAPAAARRAAQATPDIVAGARRLAADQAAGVTLGPVEGLPELLRAATRRAVRTDIPVDLRALPPDPVQGIADKLTAAVQQSRRLQIDVDEARTLERQRRVAAASRAAGGTQGRERLAAEVGELGGELPSARLEFAPGTALQEDEVLTLLQRVDDDLILPFFDRVSTKRALIGLADEGFIPTPSEIRLFETAFGKKFAEAIASQIPQGKLHTFLDATGIPRALKSAFDISFPLRQGALLIDRGPWWTSWKPMIRAFKNADFADDWDEILKGGPRLQQAAREGDQVALDFVNKAKLRREVGLDLTTLTAGRRLSAAEESFQSNLAERLPFGVGAGVRASERSFVTYGNVLRAGVFDDMADLVMRQPGLSRAEQIAHLEEYARWINIATGRGPIPANLKEVTVILNRVLFSPRLLLSRFQALGVGGQAVAETAISPLARAAAGPVRRAGLETAAGVLSRPTSLRAPVNVRRAVARDVVAFAGAGVSLLTMLNASGLASVELDPRSSDFGKGNIGGTRWDPWGGFQQIARYTTQFLTGETKSAGTGKVKDVDRIDVLGRFGRSKLDPGVPALVVNVATGETFLGDDFDLASLEGTGRALRDTFMPLYFDDLVDGFQTEGLLGAAKVAPAGAGLGAQAFETFREEENRVARELFNRDFLELARDDRGKVHDRLDADFDDGEVDVDAVLNFAFDRLATLADGTLPDGTPDPTSQASRIRSLLASGAPRSDINQLVREVNEERFTSANALLGDPLLQDALTTDNPVVVDIYAERFRALTPPPLDENLPQLGLDFRAWQEQRDLVVDEALAAQSRGEIPADRDVRAYLTGRGDGSYLNDRFEDPNVNAVFAERDALLADLNDSGFFDLTDEAWALTQRGLAGDTIDFDTRREWEFAKTESLISRLLRAGADEISARDQAADGLRLHPVVKRDNRHREIRRDQFWKSLVTSGQGDLLLRAIEWDFVGAGGNIPEWAEGLVRATQRLNRAS